MQDVHGMETIRVTEELCELIRGEAQQTTDSQRHQSTNYLSDLRSSWMSVISGRPMHEVLHRAVFSIRNRPRQLEKPCVDSLVACRLRAKCAQQFWPRRRRLPESIVLRWCSGEGLGRVMGCRGEGEARLCLGLRDSPATVGWTMAAAAGM